MSNWKNKQRQVFTTPDRRHDKRDNMRDSRRNDSDDLKSDLVLGAATSIDQLTKLLADVESHSVTTGSPYFMNQLFAGVRPESVLAESLIARTRTTLATFEASPIFSQIEEQVVKSLGKIFGWPPASDGVCVPGGSNANFMALHCARYRQDAQFKSQGMARSGVAPLKIYVSAQSHYSFAKACAVLGFGTDNLVSVPVDKQGCMVLEQLEKLIREDRYQGHSPLMVAATAGTTVYGAFDPIQDIARVCRNENLWLHVDAAWGGPVIFSNKWRHLLQGVELADSVTFDAHKLLGAGLTSSFYLTKHQDILLQANDVAGGDYLFHSLSENVDRGRLSWQCGRPADALKFWTIWKRLGDQGLANHVDRLMNVRSAVVNWIASQPRLELVAEPMFLNICVRVLPPRSAISTRDCSWKRDWTLKVREELKRNNIAFVNYSSDADGPFLRLILAHHEITEVHVINLLTAALDVGESHARPFDVET